MWNGNRNSVVFEVLRSKAIWFGSDWALKLDEVQICLRSKLVQFNNYAPDDLQQDQITADHFSLLAAVTIDVLWKLRSSVLFGGGKV